MSVDANAERLRRLRWRARRGLLENDLVLERFFERHSDAIDEEFIGGLDTLLDLPDSELLDLIVGRSDLPGQIDRPAVRKVLALLREA